jgi:hypothetical protein
VRTGKPGRPRKVPDRQILAKAMGSNSRISKSQLAAAIGLHRNSVHKYLKAFQIPSGYTDITDDALDSIIKDFRRQEPESGIRVLMGRLLASHIKVTKQRIKDSLERVDPVGQVLHARTAINRREYHVPRPNAMWHIDGHHKLIRWGIVIHGIIDGFCRTVRSHLYNTCNT